MRISVNILVNLSLLGGYLDLEFKAFLKLLFLYSYHFGPTYYG